MQSCVVIAFRRPMLERQRIGIQGPSDIEPRVQQATPRSKRVRGGRETVLSGLVQLRGDGGASPKWVGRGGNRK
eukprot:929000-Pyramimonas_sp.AAC.1